MICDRHLTCNAISQKFNLRQGDLKFLEVSLFTYRLGLKHVHIVMEELWLDFRGKTFPSILNTVQADYRALPNSH